MKKFFKKTEGFTLVELIVVIAILGILAGVGTVGYSGYIKKANLAADQQLLASASTAINIACIENNIDAMQLRGAEIMLNEDGTIDTENGPLDITNTAAYAALPATMSLRSVAATAPQLAANINAAFLEGFPCEGVQFKVFLQVIFNGASFDGYDSEGGVYGQLEFDEESINTVKNSAFFTAPGLGVSNLMDKVSYITGLASSLADQEANNGAWQMLQNYNDDMLADLGIEMPTEEDLAGMTPEQQDEAMATAMAPLYDLVNAKVAALEKQNPAALSGMTEDEKFLYAQNEILASYAVLDAAKQMKGQNPTDVLNTIKGTSNFTALIKDSENGISQASAAYGLYTAYAYSLPENDPKRAAAIAAANDPVNLLKAMDDEGFRAYLDTPKAEDDLAGYMAAMEMVDSSASNKEAVNALLVNGFTDPQLIAVIQNAMK